MEHLPYNYFRALRVYVKTSLRAIGRNPSSIIFGFVFPLIFILIFGFMGNRSWRLSVGVLSGSERTNPVLETLSHVESVKLITDQTDDQLIAQLEKGELEALIAIEKRGESYRAHVKTSNASPNGAIFLNMLRGLTAEMNLILTNPEKIPVTIEQTIIEGRPYRTIDFILPGQLGFVLLSSGIFGTAYVLIALKSRLVIKRMFATPAPRSIIILGEAIARMIFALIQVTVIILIGKFLFGFTLVHGITTFVMLLFVCVLSLMVFLGFGMIVSNIAKHEQAVPPIANLIVMPQFLLAGTFFSINAFPEWLQPVCRMLPLTYVNDALRRIAYDGAGFSDLGMDFLVLGIWGIIVYAVTFKIFKWE